jgi:putative membrane protein
MGGMDGSGMMDQGGGMMLVWALVLLVVLGVGAFVAYQLTRRPRPERQLESSAVQLLERRLAAGEIDDEEYLRRRSALDSR